MADTKQKPLDFAKCQALADAILALDLVERQKVRDLLSERICLKCWEPMPKGGCYCDYSSPDYSSD